MDTPDVQALATLQLACDPVFKRAVNVGLDDFRMGRRSNDGLARDIARAVLAAHYRPAPEPTGQTREQIAEVLRRLPTEVTPHVGECVYPDEACSCRAMEIRVDLAARIDGILAVHVSPETAEERECECGNPVSGYRTNTLCPACHHAAFGGGEDIG